MYITLINIESYHDTRFFTAVSVLSDRVDAVLPQTEAVTENRIENCEAALLTFFFSSLPPSRIILFMCIVSMCDNYRYILIIYVHIHMYDTYIYICDYKTRFSYSSNFYLLFFLPRSLLFSYQFLSRINNSTIIFFNYYYTCL